MKLARLIAATLALALSACGSGGSSGNSTTAPPAATPVPVPPPVVTVNTATLTLDGGPAALKVGSSGYTAFNEPYVAVTLCAPGTSTCQTIDHVILDTGSVGLRIIRGVIDPALFAALPTETGATGNPVGECYQYVNSYVFGSVRKADFAIAGEKVASLPFHVIGDDGSFATVPAKCSSGGGTAIVTVQDFGANGVLGIGTTTTDCGAQCAVAGGSSAASYYDCPASGCGAIIARASSIVAPFEQLPNPVAAFPADNNGSVITLPAVPPSGSPVVTGTVIFGIGTQADNSLTATTVLPLTTSSSRFGPGVLTVAYKSQTLTQSFFDTGSSEYFFIDTTLPACTDTNLLAFYCPTTPTALTALLTATNGAAFSFNFTLYSPTGVANSSTVAPGLGLNPTLIKPPLPFANSFDFGLPFFLGRTVFTAIEDRTAGNVVGPYVAF